MDAADLKIFEAVARLGGMNRAAAELNTVQSNVTARVRLLEDQLGTVLFHRSSRGVALTAAGRRLLPYALQVGHLLKDAHRAVRDEGKPAGSLTIGSLETTAAMRLSPVLARYAAAYPEVDLALVTGTSRELTDAVLDRRVEGAFVCGPVDHPELDEQVIFREELVLITSPAVRALDRLARNGELKIVVLRAGCSYRERLEAILNNRGVAGVRRLEFGTIEGIIGCVAAGLGVSLLPKALLATAVRERRIRVHPLPKDEHRVETLFIRRRDSFASSALTAFLRYARPAAGHRKSR